MSFAKLRTKFGESTEPVLKYKKKNLKQLSSLYEQQAKEHSLSEMKKTEERKKLIREKEKEHKLNLEEIKQIREKALESNDLKEELKSKLTNEYQIKLMKKISSFENPNIDDEETKKDINLLTKAYQIKAKRNYINREYREQVELEMLLNRFKEYYFRDYHYIYQYPYKKQKVQISCFKEGEEIKENMTDVDYLDKDYDDVYQGKKLLSIKNLQRYDCWPDLSPEEWMAWCRELSARGDDYHGKSITYEPYEKDPDKAKQTKVEEYNPYKPKQIKVEGYDPEAQKFHIYFHDDNTKKTVSRLSILFKTEIESEWNYRKFLCEQRRDRNDEAVLFSRYVDNVPLSLIYTINEKTMKRIFKYLLFDKKNLAAKYNKLFSTDNLLFKAQLKIVEQDYIRQMKKCRMLMEFQEIKNLGLFFKRNLKYKGFFKSIQTPTFGIVKETRSLLSMKQKVKKFSKDSIYEDSLLTEVVCDFLKQCEEFKKIKILINSYDKTKLPITRAQFKIDFARFNEKSIDKITNLAKNSLKNKLIDKLG